MGDVSGKYFCNFVSNFQGHVSLGVLYVGDIHKATHYFYAGVVLTFTKHPSIVAMATSMSSPPSMRTGA